MSGIKRSHLQRTDSSVQQNSESSGQLHVANERTDGQQASNVLGPLADRPPRVATQTPERRPFRPGPAYIPPHRRQAPTEPSQTSTSAQSLNQAPPSTKTPQTSSKERMPQSRPSEIYIPPHRRTEQKADVHVPPTNSTPSSVGRPSTDSSEDDERICPTVMSTGFLLGQHRHAGEQFAVTNQDPDSLIAVYGKTAFSGLKPGARILDVACSVGSFVDRLREMGYEAEGVDAKPPYLIDSPHIRTGVPIEDAELPPNTYEAIFSSRGPFTFTDLHLFSNKNLKQQATERRFIALKNMAKALVPGGGLCI